LDFGFWIAIWSVLKKSEDREHMITQEQQRPLEQRAAHHAAAQQGIQAQARLFFVDHLRVFLTILVVIHHLAITYGAVAIWYYVEPPQNPITPMVTGLLVLLNQAFFMGAFFLIAGYFTPGAYDRKGANAFLRDRFVRLGIPLLVYTLLIHPLVSFAGYSYLPEVFRPGPLLSFQQVYLLTFGPGPLWFVEALLLFGVLYALWRRLTRQRPSPATRLGAPPTYPAIIAFTLILTGVTFLFRIGVPMGLYLPIIGFPTASHLPQYIGLFIVGSLAYRSAWFQRMPGRVGKVGFGAAIGATVLLVPPALGDITEGAFLGGMNWQAFVYALWESIFCVGMCLGLLTLFRKRFNQQRAIGCFLSTNAYTAYIIHAPVIVGLAIALRAVQIDSLLKFALVTLIALPLCFISAYIVRKLPLARRVL
jgi:surface polysaccharide O-acyltransferase-like enzyme